MSGGFHRAGCCCGGIEPGAWCEHCSVDRTPLNYTVTHHNAAYATNGVAVVCDQDDDGDDNPCTWYGTLADIANPGLPFQYRVTVTAPNTMTVSIRRWVGLGYGDIFLHVGADFTGDECDEVNLAGLANMAGGGGTADAIAGP